MVSQLRGKWCRMVLQLRENQGRFGVTSEGDLVSQLRGLPPVTLCILAIKPLRSVEAELCIQHFCFLGHAMSICIVGFCGCLSIRYGYWWGLNSYQLMLFFIRQRATKIEHCVWQITDVLGWLQATSLRTKWRQGGSSLTVLAVGYRANEQVSECIHVLLLVAL